MSRLLKLNRCYIDPKVRSALAKYTQWIPPSIGWPDPEKDPRFIPPDSGQLSDEILARLGHCLGIDALVWIVMEYMADFPSSTRINLGLPVEPGQECPSPGEADCMIRQLSLDKYLKRGDVIFPPDDEHDGNASLLLWTGNAKR